MPTKRRAGRDRPRARVPTGRVPGVPVPSTAKSAANAWKHGRFARVVTGAAGPRAQIEKKFPGVADVIDSYAGAITDGDPRALDGLAVVAMSQSELLRQDMVRAVQREGVLVQDDIIGMEGGKAKVIGHRHKANPVLEPLRHFTEILGHTAEQHQLTRKSRGEGAVNAAVAFRIARDERLRNLERPHRPMAPPAIDAEVVG